MTLCVCFFTNHGNKPIKEIIYSNYCQCNFLLIQTKVTSVVLNKWYEGHSINSVTKIFSSNLQIFMYDTSLKIYISCGYIDVYHNDN